MPDRQGVEADRADARARRRGDGRRPRARAAVGRRLGELDRAGRASSRSRRSRASPARCCAPAPDRRDQHRPEAPVAHQGRAARGASPLRPAVLTLAISDVPCDDPAVIASGPTVPDPSTLADARAIVARRKVPLPASRRGAARQPGERDAEARRSGLFAQPSSASSPARPMRSPRRRRARCAAGYEPLVLGADLEGEAREVAAAHAEMAQDARAAGRRAAILSGGELTVTMRGQGRGGPNQEYALALAVALDGARRASRRSPPTPTAPTAAAARPTTPPARSSTTPRSSAPGRSGSTRRRFSPRTIRQVSSSASPTSSARGPTRTNVNDCRIILMG